MKLWPSALLLTSLTLAAALGGCLSGDPEEPDDEPVVEPTPPPQNLTHNVTTYQGQITLQAKGPTEGSYGSASHRAPHPIITTINYTGLVVKLEWTPASAATETLRMKARPDSDSAEPIDVAGSSPLKIVIDMTQPVPRNWYLTVATDDSSNPVSAGANQPYLMTVGQYAGANGTFDPEWDPPQSP